MTTPIALADANVATSAVDPTTSETGLGRSPWWPLLARPILIAALVAGLYLWVDGIALDSIEERTVNREFLFRTTREHLWLTVTATAIVLSLAIPTGILLTRRRMRGAAQSFLSVLGVGQAIPAYGLMVLLSLWLGIGFRTAVIALGVYSFLPVLRNFVTGILGVDAAVVEAGTAMGMSPAQILWRIELRLAVPLVLTGIRTSLVIGAGVATLATFVNAGGLGDIIINGIKLNRTPVLVTGSVLCACVALFFDWVGALAERLLSPRGLS